MKRKILLFIPCYNCEKQIPRVLNQLDNEVLKYIDEVLLINNRSTDSTEKAIILSLQNSSTIPGKLIRNNQNYGLGGSHKVAFNYALSNNFDYVIVLHGDDQGNVHDILPYIANGDYIKYDSLLGSRFDRDSKLINYSKFRIFGNKVFNILFTITAKHSVTDLGSGLNMYSCEYLRSRFYMSFVNSLSFNVYMLLYGVYSKSKFVFFPLSWREDDQVSNAKFFKQSLELMKLINRYIFTRKELFAGINDFSKADYSYEVIYQNEQRS